MQYFPLKVERNEIRLLKILPQEKLDEPATQIRSQEIIQCTLEHVSLDEFTEDSKDYFSQSGKDVYTAEAFWDRMREKYRAAGLLPPRHSEEEDDANLRAKECKRIGFTVTSSPRWGRWTWGDYIALSYTWGTWENAQEIIVNGHVVKVTENLHAFLQQMRKTPTCPSGCGLWIDALCIDQSDIDERNAQVKRMTLIYEQAFAAVAWLGKEADNSAMAFNLLSKLAGVNASGSKRELASFLGQAEFDNLPLGSWNALQVFFERPYWKRLWIVQEIVLSNSTMAVMCGDMNIGWGYFQHAIDLLATDFSLLHSRYTRDANALGVPTHPLQGFVRLQQLSRFYQPCSEGKVRLSLGDVLSTARLSEQSDDRDKVYGVMSLIPPAISKAITPNYRHSIQQVFKDLVHACIATTGSLDIICQARCNVLDGTQWPSWLPDFRLRPTVDQEFTRKRPYHACKEAKVAVQFTNDGCLSARGFIIDNVDGLGYGLTDSLSAETLSLDFEQIFLEGMPVTQPTQSPALNPYQSERGLRNALWRTLVADRDDFGDSAPDSYESIIHIPIKPTGNHAYLVQNGFFVMFSMARFCNQNLQVGEREFLMYFPLIKTEYELPPPEVVPLILSRCCTLMFGRKLLITGKGYVGLAPITAQKGDIIAILFGCSMPVILRRYGDKGYKLVGEAYVHGIMEGEALGWLGEDQIHDEMFDIY
jgi:hypothetical protein